MDVKFPQVKELIEKVDSMKNVIENLQDKILPASAYITPKQLEERYHLSASTRKRLGREGIIKKKFLGGKGFYDLKEVEQAII